MQGLSINAPAKKYKDKRQELWSGVRVQKCYFMGNDPLINLYTQYTLNFL